MGTIQDIKSTASGAFTGGISFDSQYNTPTLTSKSQNDYNVPNLDTYNVIVFTSTKDIDLKGIDSSLLTGWNGYIILNGNSSGGKKIKLKKNQNSSTAEYRFNMKDDIDLEPGDFWWIIYNQDQQRWNAQAKL
jgi:hypothetical protein